ncbi:glycosyltransferase family 29 protein [Sinorhizobium psoraleae]|uniref:Glycosyltransferase family 29 protein n=1 Tax=Sinorhizobium psoraleae TaxID=520838 RepID=A0ABT4KK78_9HYPH|nr:glycosyltransferase family 29 protein [Sinorhizobium psoraleae]MCZ4092378.1 glycosyltransferase family 29 protein [Sinorhizobium psoraleae]
MDGTRPDFQTALKEVDIFVLTSRDDPSPLVVFEALATGHPAYAFATTGFNEMLPREFVALDPDDMCRKLCEKIETFKPDPKRFRALADNFSVEKFRDRAFRPRHSIDFNLPIFDQEVVDLYEEKDADTLDARLRQLRSEQTKLLNLMRAIERERVSLDGRGRRLDHIVKERDALKGAARRLAADLKLEHYREARRLARSSRKKTSSIPFIGKTENLKVLVLGNAPSVLQRNLGEKIDKFDVVVRVNNFRVKGFEKHIGSKTSYALISPACMQSDELSGLPPSKVFVIGANMRDDYEKIKARLMDKDRGCQVLPPPENVLKSSIYVDALRVEMDFDLAENQWPSTGIVAVQWARDMHGKAATVYVHGFDFYSDNRITLSRYFDVTTKADGKHDFDREKAYMQSLLDKGAIKRL